MYARVEKVKAKRGAGTVVDVAASFAIFDFIGHSMKMGCATTKPLIRFVERASADSLYSGVAGASVAAASWLPAPGA